MVMRVATNTLFGIGGLLDIASDLGIAAPASKTSARRSAAGACRQGPYLVWPLFGPSSLRDSVALPLDLSWATGALTNDGAARIGLTVLELIDIRARLLDADSLIDAIALDNYVFIRDGYLSRRRSLVYDGESDPNSPDDGKGEAGLPCRR